MNQKTVKFLAAATAAFAAAFVAASGFRDSSTAASGIDEPVLPILQDRVNDVSKVVIESKDETLTLDRAADGWTLAEKAGYEANAGKVRELILAMRDARVIEEKTAKKERFGKLGLDDPAVEDATSKRVTLQDEKGEAIASLLIGDQRFSKGGGANPNVTPGQQYYVHGGGESPAVLATGELRIDARAVGWVEQKFLDLPRTRIQAARVTHPDGTTVEAARAAMEDNEMVPLGAPEGMQPKEFNGTRPFLDALASLRFDDVQKEGEIDWEAYDSTFAEIFTEHNLRARVETVEIPNDDAELDDDGQPLPGQSKIWARFTFDVADAAEKPAAPIEEEPALEEPAEEGSEEEGANAEDSNPEEEGPSVADLAAEVAKLTESTKGWAYAIPSWKSNGFRMKPDGIFEPIPEAPLPPEPTPLTDEMSNLLNGSGDNEDG